MKKITQIGVYKKSRKFWNMKPTEKVIEIKKIYNRKKNKQQLYREIINDY